MADTARPARPDRSGAPTSTTVELSHRQIMTILSGLIMGMFLASLDQTIVTTSIRTIADDLHGLSQQAWTTTAYLIASTISTPLYGKLSDLYGRRPFYLAAISIFVLGSTMCTFATSMIQLAAFRAFQGLGAGGLIALALAIIGDIVPPRERARYQAYIMSVFGCSTVIGPLIGGFFAGQATILGIAGWRWVFLVNVPIGVAAFIVVAKVLRVPHLRREHSIDWLGAVFIVVGVVPLLLVAEQGRVWGWMSGRSVACYLTGILGIIAWIFVEKRAKEDALIPMKLFRNGVFSMTSLVSVVFGMAMFGGMVMIPQYLQIVRGASPTKSGLLMIPLMIGLMGTSIVSGRMTSRTGHYKMAPVIGCAVSTVAMLCFGLFVDVNTSLFEVGFFMLLMGAGFGPAAQALSLSAQTAVPPSDIGVASSSTTFFRQMGATAGTAVFLSVLFSNVGGKIASAFAHIAPGKDFQAAAHDPAVLANPSNQAVVDMLKPGGGGKGASSVLSDSSFIQHIDPRLALPFKTGFADAMHTVFFAGAGVMFLAFVLMACLKELPLRNVSGLAARANAEKSEGASELVAHADV